jgi:hypothetical protein
MTTQAVQEPGNRTRTTRELPESIEPMIGIDGWAAALNCSRRAVERLRSARKLPRPDLMVGKMPRWKAETLRSWIDSGGKEVA